MKKYNATIVNSIFQIAVLAIAYFVFGRLGLVLDNPSGYVSPIWPAAGFALAGLLFFGYRAWPGIFIGSFMTNLPSGPGIFSIGADIHSYIIPISIAFGSTLQALTGAFLINRYIDLNNGLVKAKDITLFYLFSGVLSCIISPLWGVNTLFLSGIITESNYVFSLLTWWVGDTIGVLIIVPLIFILFAEPKAIWEQRRISIGLPMTLMLILIVILFSVNMKQENTRIESKFNEQTLLISNAININLEKNAEMLYSLRNFFNVSETVDAGKFRTFLNDTLQSHTDIHAISWNSVVYAAQKEGFEKKMEMQGHPGFMIKEGSKDSIIPAKKRDKYVVVTYIEPYIENQNVVGYDVYSNSSRRLALDAACSSAKLTATDPITLVQEKATQSGVLFFLPVYRSAKIPSTLSERNRQLKGYIVGVYRTGDLLLDSIKKFQLHNVAISLVDQTDPENTLPLAAYVFDHNGKSKPIDDLESLKLYELQTKNTISIGEKKWGLTLYATPEYITENLSIVSWGILTASLLFATLLELFLLLLTGRTILFRNMAQELSNEVERSKILEEDLKRTNEDLENRVVERTQSLSEKNRELKKAEEKFKGYLELASDGIHILDENGNVVECSRSFAESIGYSYEEALRLNIKEWDATISPDQPISPAIKEMIASPSTFETTHKRKDGTLFDVQISAKGIEMEGEYYLYASSRDITESKRIKEQLIQAKEQADQANLSKSHFLANMSHEIRTPMNAILGFVDLLAKGEKDPKRLKKFDIVKSSGQTLLNIINDILDFSKIESGQMDIEAHPYFLQEFYDEAETLFAELMHQKQITYHSTIAENVPSCIVTDQVRLKQVVFNLLSNAIKFTPERGKISLDLTYTDKKLTLSVTDTGIGIAPENLDKIFNAFVQEDGSITRKYGGTGLGLSIASRLIKKMGGELKVESTLGEGSRFFFEIPVVACETENTLKEKPHNLQNEDAAQTGLTGHALMVEDNRTNQMLLGFILDDTGITYDIANNGVEAINMFNQNRYDIILMDENMPEMNGIEATKHIRNLEKETGKHIPIIAVTANALDGDRQRFIDAGADGYISKPYAAEDIVELVQKFL